MPTFNELADMDIGQIVCQKRQHTQFILRHIIISYSLIIKSHYPLVLFSRFYPLVAFLDFVQQIFFNTTTIETNDSERYQSRADITECHADLK